MIFIMESNFFYVMVKFSELAYAVKYSGGEHWFVCKIPAKHAGDTKAIPLMYNNG